MGALWACQNALIILGNAIAHLRLPHVWRSFCGGSCPCPALGLQTADGFSAGNDVFTAYAGVLSNRGTAWNMWREAIGVVVGATVVTFILTLSGWSVEQAIVGGSLGSGL